MRRLVLVTSMLALVMGAGGSQAFARELSFADRVAAQQAIERVYRDHRVGAGETLDPALPRPALEAKVQKMLDLSLALERHWRRPVTALMLQRETERMLRQSALPDRLGELFAALGGDPLLVQETLVRGVLVDRLTANLFAFDSRLHAASRLRAEQLRGQLQRGEIDPHAAHALRVERSSGLDTATSTVGSLPVGAIGPLREDPRAFIVEVVLDRVDTEVRVARYSVAKRTREDWLREAVLQWGRHDLSVVGSDDATLTADAAKGVAPGCPAGEWRPLTEDVPSRAQHSAVWTGSELIVWGGAPGSLATGDRYDPATDTWTPTSTVNAPEGRLGHTAVWTGQEMIVWGGRWFEPATGEIRFPGGGARYDPAQDLWRPVSTLNARPGGYAHSATWTGTEMIVWGGYSFDSEGNGVITPGGSRYDPVTDLWTPISTSNAPEAHVRHLALWTGTEMIVLGAHDALSPATWTGGRYDPLTDTWTPMTTVDAPTPRLGATLVWTGTEMIVWGGSLGSNDPALATGGRYDPASDTWTPTSLTDAPVGRYRHSAIWTGARMLVWGGSPERFEDELASGAAYDPVSDSWMPTATLDAPRMRADHTATWTGAEMIVWGGLHYREALREGARYDPATGAWTSVATADVRAPISWNLAESMEAVWTGSEMLVLNGTGDRGRYDPATASWSDIAPTATPPNLTVMVWAGDRLIVWSGEAATSGRYDPVTDTWAPMSELNAPPANRFPTVVWTGTEMIVWGGTQELVGEGGRYDPLTDQWTPTSTVDAPAGRWYHSAVWTGSEMIVWGGVSGHPSPLFGPGGRYDPVLDRWLPVSEVGAPSGRYRGTAIWTGAEMIVWGGAYPDDPAGEPAEGTGGRYDPATDAWVPVTTLDAPLRREWPTAVWTGDAMIVWGGNAYVWSNQIGAGFQSGGHYAPTTDTWEAMALDGAPPGRAWHYAFWTGESLLVWGGRTQGGGPTVHLDGGGLYTPSIDADVDGVCLADDCDDADPDNWASCATCADVDADGWFAGCDAYSTIDGPDCADGDPDTHPGAPEINDGADNQCPGEAGHGAVDEISGIMVFESAERLHWTPQAGAGLYEVARSAAPDFSAACLTATAVDALHDAPGAPGPGPVWYYLVRAVEGSPGSWGLRSDGAERAVPCASP